MFRNLWQSWLHLARHIGNFQARALITLVYFVFILPFGILARLFSDPLRLKKTQADSDWLARQTRDLDLTSARRQG